MIGSVCGLILLFIIDRVTKMWAVSVCSSAPVAFNSWFSCSYALNRGVNWSLLHSDSTVQFCLITAVIMVVMGFLAQHMLYRYRQGYAIYGESLILVGACSNLWDRFWYGGVVDFIMIHYQDFVWPLFNVADIAVVTGVMIMAFSMVKE